MSYDVESCSLLSGLLEVKCFDEWIRELVSFSCIRLQACDNGSGMSYFIDAEAHKMFAGLLSSEWSMLALKVVCHVFPRDPILDQR